METSLLSMVLQSLLGLAFVLGLFALLVWIVRHFKLAGDGTVQRDFKIVQRLHIDSKNSIVEIQHKGQAYLLGLSPGGMVQLHGDQSLNSETHPSTEQAADHEA